MFCYSFSNSEQIEFSTKEEFLDFYNSLDKTIQDEMKSFYNLRKYNDNSSFDSNKKNIIISSYKNYINKSNTPSLYKDSEFKIIKEGNYTFEGYVDKEGNKIKGKIDYKGNFIYEGEFKNDKFHGIGKITLNDGTIYESLFKDGIPNGKTKITAPDGSILTAQFFNGEISGVARLTFTNGNFFEGEFVNKAPNGEGKYVNTEGDYIHSNNWVNGVTEGDITVYIKSRNEYKYLKNLNISLDELDKADKLIKSIKNNKLDKKQNITNNVDEIYLELGNKTQSENVVIKPVYQKEGVEYAKSISGIFSLGLNYTDKHFGNPFLNIDSNIVDNAFKYDDNWKKLPDTKENRIKYITSQGLIPTNSTQESVERYIDWILNGYKIEVKGINIYTKSTDPLGRRLTNPNWYAKDLMDVEGPYKANSSKVKAPHLSPEEALRYDMNLMYKLQVEKFKRHPELIDEINERGGLAFILASEHIVGVPNSRWEGKGLESNFIKVLAKSYETVAKQLNKFQESPELQPERRKWILEQLKSGNLKGKPIVYYKELGEPSHATALDYLINKYDWKNQDIQDEKSSVNVTFDKELAKKIQEKLQKLYPEIKLNITNNPVWEEGDNIFNQKEFDKQVNYRLKATEILLSDKAKQIFEKGKKANWSLDKILTELQVPKEQKNLLLDLGITDREQLSLELVSSYTFSIEINTAKEDLEDFEMVDETGEGDFQPREFIPDTELILEEDEDGNVIGIREVLSERGKKQIEERENKRKPTQYYSDLTVPGGTNYTENEIATPLIKPNIKSHTQFSTYNGIGWFRSDDKIIPEYEEGIITDLGINIEGGLHDTGKLDKTKTRRILEMQSDLFQKGRSLKDLISDSYQDDIDDKIKNQEEIVESLIKENASKEKIETEIKLLEAYKNQKETQEKFIKLSDNKFLQILNKNNNWVNFFVKAIIQDSAKKGYEKVLFPTSQSIIPIETAGQGDYKNIDEARVGFKWSIEKEQGWLKRKKEAKTQEEKNIIHRERPTIFGTIEFYEKLGNILEELYGKENVKQITDEYGNTWYEITINQARDLSHILLQRNEANQIIDQANIKAGTILIDAIKQKQDTLPNEYAHHYIAWFRDTPIVQEAIKKWGSEEALVQSIGEQAVKQKGEAWDWWNNFVKWIINQFNSLSKLEKQELTQILTDAFLTRQDLRQQKQQVIKAYSDFLESLNHPNTNPELLNSEQEQLEKFKEYQQLLNNKEFVEAVKDVYESSENTNIKKEVSKLSKLIVSNKKEVYTLYNSILNRNVSKNGYKVTIPEFPDVVMYITQENFNSENTDGSAELNTKNKEWTIEILHPIKGVMAFPKSIGISNKKDVLEDFITAINEKHSKSERDREILSELGIFLGNEKLSNKESQSLKDIGTLEQYIDFRVRVEAGILKSDNSIEGFKEFVKPVFNEQPVKKTLSSKENPLVIYSDGSDIKGTGQIGYGAVMEYKGKEYIISGTENSEDVKEMKKMFPNANFSNPTMEMLALVSVLESFQDTSEHLSIFQDYIGAVNYEGLWDYSKDSQQRREKPWKPKESYIKYLVDRAVKAIKKIESNGGSVKINWIKSHSNNKMNDKADAAAKNREIKNTFSNIFNDIEEEFELQNKEVKGIEINSEEKGLGNYLNNIHYAVNGVSEFDIIPSNKRLKDPSKVEIRKDDKDVSWAITKGLKTYADVYGKSVEAWYKANSSDFFNINNEQEKDKYDFDLVVSLITDKLIQYPNLIQEINKNGGLEFLQKSTHTLDNSRWSNPKNMFINGLIEAYKSVLEMIERNNFKVISIATDDWKKDTPKEDINTAYIFTENINSIGDSRTGQGSAIIRNNPNAIGIITKKRYIYKENRNPSDSEYNQDFKDTDEDFELFKSVNLKQFEKIDKYKSIIFTKSFDDNLSSLPIRFVIWLQDELFKRYGLVTEINNKKNGLISKFVVTIDKNKKLFNTNDKNLKTGSVVLYDNDKYIVIDGLKLIDEFGKIVHESIDFDKLTVLGSFPVVNNKYIVTDKKSIYSSETGSKLVTSNNNLFEVQKILEQAIIERFTKEEDNRESFDDLQNDYNEKLPSENKEFIKNKMLQPYKGFQNFLWYYFAEKAKEYAPEKYDSIVNAKDFHTAYLIGADRSRGSKQNNEKGIQDPNDKVWNRVLSEFINNNKDNNNSKLYKTEILGRKYSYNPETKEVIYNSKAGDIIENNEKIVNRVLVEYALDREKYELKSFSGRFYVKINGKILDVNTYQQTFRREIVSLFETPKQQAKDIIESEFNFSYKGITVPTAFQLGKQQEEALKRIIDYIENGRNIEYYTLEGYAGTGKTTIIQIAENYIRKKGAGNFVYLAPTHSAVVSLGEASAANGGKQFPNTVQSAIVPRDIKISKKARFSNQIKDLIVPGRTTIILDEFSMLDTEYYYNLVEACNENSVKLIFMGDTKQIPEIQNKYDSKGNPYKTVSIISSNPNKSELTEVFRTKNNKILSILTEIRSKTEFENIRTNNTDSVKFLSYNLWLEEALKDFKKDRFNTIMITYTNEGVKRLNQKVRESLGYKGTTKVGENIIGYLGSANKQIKRGDLCNSINYVIENIFIDKSGIVELEGYSPRLKKLFDKMKSSISPNFKCNYIQLSNSDSLHFELTEEQIENNKQLVKARLKEIFELNKLLEQAINKKDFRSYGSLKEDINEKYLWFAYNQLGDNYVYDSIKDTVVKYQPNLHDYERGGLRKEFIKIEKGVDYGYATTVHKSQGMTIDNVYFDIDSISKVRNIPIFKDNVLFNTEKNAIYYVGMSRASKKLVVNSADGRFIEPEEKKPLLSPTFVDSTIVNLNVLRNLIDDLGINVEYRNDGKLFEKSNDKILINIEKFKLKNTMSDMIPLFYYMYNKVSENYPFKDYYKTELDYLKDKFEGKILNDVEHGEDFIKFFKDITSKVFKINYKSNDVKRDTIKDKYFPKEIMKSSEILKKISESNHPLKELAKNLLKVVSKNDVDISLVYSEDFKLSDNITGSGVYYPDKNSISIYAYLSDNFHERVILHEIIHSLTYNELRTNYEVNQYFNELYEHAKKYINNNIYPLSNIDEFMTGIFTNAEFVKQLMMVPSLNRKKYKNYFEELFDYILSLFKVDKKDNLYEEAFAVASNIITQRLPDTNVDFEKQKFEVINRMSLNDILSITKAYDIDIIRGNNIYEETTPEINDLIASGVITQICDLTIN